MDLVRIVEHGYHGTGPRGTWSDVMAVPEQVCPAWLSSIRQAACWNLFLFISPPGPCPLSRFPLLTGSSPAPSGQAHAVQSCFSSSSNRPAMIAMQNYDQKSGANRRFKRKNSDKNVMWREPLQRKAYGRQRHDPKKSQLQRK